MANQIKIDPATGERIEDKPSIDPVTGERVSAAPVSEIQIDPATGERVAASAPAPKPSLLSRIIGAVKPKAESAPKDLEGRLAAKAKASATTQTSVTDPRMAPIAALDSSSHPAPPKRGARTEIPAFPTHTAAPRTPAAAADATAFAGTKPRPAATEPELQQENDKRRALSEEVIEKEFEAAVKAGFTKAKYGTHEGAVRAYLDAIERPAPKPLASTAELDAERGRRGANLTSMGELEAEIRADGIAGAAEKAASPAGRGEAYEAENTRRLKAIEENAVASVKAGFGSSRDGIRRYMESVGKKFEAPYVSPEAFAEERAGVSRGTSVAGKAAVNAGDAWSGVSAVSGWQAITNALTGRSSADRAGERIIATESGLKDREEVAAIEAKKAKGETLTALEQRRLEESGFFAQLGAAVEAVRENPGAVTETMLVDLIENAPVYAMTNIGSVGAAKALTGAVKGARNAERLASAIAKGKSAAAAEIRAQKTAALGAKVIKPSMLKTIGIEVASDLPADVAVGMVLEKAKGREYRAADLVTDLAASGIINVPLGALRSLRGGGVLTAREFRQVADAFGDIGALATEPALADILTRLKTLAGDKVLVDEGLKVSATGRAKAATEAEARTAGYSEDVATGSEEGRQILGSTEGAEIKLRPGADLATLEEEISTARFNALKKRAAATPTGPEAALLGRINDWAASVHAENLSRPPEQRVALPQQSEAGNLELFTKALAQDETGVELVPLVDVPDDIFNEWGKVFNTKSRVSASEPRPGVMTGAYVAPPPVPEPRPAVLGDLVEPGMVGEAAGRRPALPVDEADVTPLTSALERNAARGKRRPLPQYQLRAPETPEFKKWFGESKVVDAEGKPLVVYHGSNRPTPEQFDTKKFGDLLGEGTYFTASPDEAGTYTNAGDAGKIVPAYISIKNPYEISSILGEIPTRKAIEEMGHDGIVLKNKDGSVKWAVAYEPAQIKSATGNRGTFSPTDPRINFQLRGKRTPGAIQDQARLQSIDIMKGVIASDKPVSAQTVATRLGLKGKAAEAAVKRAIPMIKAVRGGKALDEALAADALKDLMIKPSETFKQTIDRVTKQGITGTEVVRAREAMRMAMAHLDMIGQRDQLRTGLKDAARIRRAILIEARRLPPEDRGSLLYQIANVDGLRTARHPQQFRAVLEKIDAILTKNIKDDLVSQVASLLKTDATQLRPEFRGAFEEIIGGLQKSSPTESTISGLEKLSEWYEANKSKADGEFVNESDLIPQSRLDKLKRLDQRAIRDMSIDELRDIIDDAGRILHMNAEKNSIIGRNALRKLDETTEEAAEQIEAFNPPLKESAEKRKEPGFISRTLRSRSSPEVMLSEIGGPGGVLVRDMYYEVALAQSDRYKTQNEMRNILSEFFKMKGMDDNKLIDWKREGVRVRLGGRDMTVTRGQLVSLYAMTRNRDTLQEVMDAGLIQKGFKGEREKIVNPSLDEINGALSKMTGFDRELGDALIQIFDLAKPLMNDVSVKLEGHEKYLVPNYFPRSRDISGREEELTDLRRFTRGGAIENRGFTRSRKSSKDPVVLDDAIDAFDLHSKEIADYANMAIPIRNALRILGNPGVKEAITTRFGARAIKDIEDYLRDVSGLGAPASNQPLDAAARALGRLFATGKLGWRLTTILNNLFGAATQIAGVIDPEYIKPFLANLGSGKEFGASLISSMPSSIRKKLESPEFRKDYMEMVMLDGYFEERYERDPFNVILYGQHEIAPTIATSKGGAALRRAQTLVMRPVQEAEKVSAIALYKAVRDNTSKAKAIKKMEGLFGVGGFDPNAPDIVKRYAASYTMLKMRKTQNALDDLDKSSFARDIARHPLKGIPYVFQSQLFKLNDMAHQASIDLKAAGGWSKASPDERKKFARAITAVAISAAAIPTIVSEVWGRYREGFQEQKESEEAKRWGLLMSALFNLADVVAPELGGASRVGLGAITGKSMSLGRGNYITETLDALARGSTGIFSDKDGSAERAAKMLVKSTAITGMPFESIYQIGEGIFNIVGDADPIIPYQNERYRIQKKMGIHEPTGKPRSIPQAAQAGTLPPPDEIAKLKKAEAIIKSVNGIRLKVEEGKMTEAQGEEIIKRITAKSSD